MDINNSIVFISDLTHYQLKMIQPHLLNRWPGFNIFVFRVIPKYRFVFNYDNNLHPAFFPCIKDPVYKPDIKKKYGMVLHITNESIKVKRYNAIAILKNANTISYLGHLWYSSIINYNILLNEYLDVHAANERLVIVPEIFTDQGIEYALYNSVTTKDPKFSKLQNAGMAKRFFDFNYNFNSLHFFNICLRKTRVTKKDYSVSKYSLQLLYELRERRPMTAGKAILMMQDWKGSGTYLPSIFGIGNPDSVDSIICGLLDSGLLKKNKNERLIVSKTGNSFLDMLDPGCRDIDLPGKLQVWQENWPHSQQEIEIYITNYFNNQKTFMQDIID
ncbi:hypothetical protein [Flavobacterium sp.]|uniref:hypothetical protein n=1 Tax=Flavobacterium sp. TaxID=239 RepID=UPI00374D27AF